MKNRFENAINKVGRNVILKTGSETISDTAAIYPVKHQQQSYGDTKNVYEGISEPQRYAMFCNKNFAENIKRRDIIECDGDLYMVLWTDEFFYKTGSYMKICLKKIVDEE